MLGTLTHHREHNVSVDSDWYDYMRQELVDLEERADSLTSDVDVNRNRLGSALDDGEQDALEEIHRYLQEASNRLSEARRRLKAFRS